VTEREPLLATTHTVHTQWHNTTTLTIGELELVEVQSPQDLAPCLWFNEGDVSTHQGTDVSRMGGQREKRGEREGKTRGKEKRVALPYMNTAYPDTLALVS